MIEDKKKKRNRKRDSKKNKKEGEWPDLWKISRKMKTSMSLKDVRRLKKLLRS